MKMTLNDIQKDIKLPEDVITKAMFGFVRILEDDKFVDTDDVVIMYNHTEKKFELLIGGYPADPEEYGNTWWVLEDDDIITDDRDFN